MTRKLTTPNGIHLRKPAGPVVPAPGIVGPADTVAMVVTDTRGRVIGVVSTPHDGSVSSIRQGAERLTERASAEYGDFCNAGSVTLASDASGVFVWVISPNRSHVNLVTSREGRYTLGDLSCAPSK